MMGFVSSRIRVLRAHATVISFFFYSRVVQEQRKLRRLKLDHEKCCNNEDARGTFSAFPTARALVARPKCGGGRNLSDKLFFIYECGKEAVGKHLLKVYKHAVNSRKRREEKQFCYLHSPSAFQRVKTQLLK